MKKNFIKIVIVVAALFPAAAFASTVSPTSGTSGVTTVTISGNSQSSSGQTGSDNQASFFNSSSGAFLGYTTSSGSYSIPTQAAGVVVDVVFYDNNETQHAPYCGDNGFTNGSTNLTNCLSSGNSSGFVSFTVTSSYHFLSGAPVIPYVSLGATTTSAIGSINDDALNQIAFAIGSVLAIAALLLGIGFAWDRLRRRATGTGFEAGSAGRGQKYLPNKYGGFSNYDGGL